MKGNGNRETVRDVRTNLNLIINMNQKKRTLKKTYQLALASV